MTDPASDSTLEEWESQDRLDHAYLQMNSVTGGHYVMLHIDNRWTELGVTKAASLGKFLAQFDNLIE